MTTASSDLHARRAAKAAKLAKAAAKAARVAAPVPAAPVLDDVPDVDLSNKTLILHVGHSKTGTSTIQRWLADSAPLLARHGIAYPDAARQGLAHHPLACAFLPPDKHPGWVSRKLSETAARSLRHQIATTDAHTVIASSEIMIHANPGQIAATFPLPTRVVAILRRQDLWMDSLLQHQLKALETSATPREWLDMRMASQAYDYRRRIELWERAFGPSAIRIGLFEKSDLEKGLIALFLATAGIEVDDPIEEPQPENARLARDGVEAMQYLHFGAGFERKRVLRLRPDLEDYTAAHPDPKGWQHVLPLADRLAILEASRDCNTWLRERFFPERQGELFAGSPQPDTGAPYPGPEPERLARMVEFLEGRACDPELLEALRARFLA